MRSGLYKTFGLRSNEPYKAYLGRDDGAIEGTSKQVLIENRASRMSRASSIQSFQSCYTFLVLSSFASMSGNVSSFLKTIPSFFCIIGVKARSFYLYRSLLPLSAFPNHFFSTPCSLIPCSLSLSSLFQLGFSRPALPLFSLPTVVLFLACTFSPCSDCTTPD